MVIDLLAKWALTFLWEVVKEFYLLLIDPTIINTSPSIYDRVDLNWEDEEGPSPIL